MQGSRGIAGKRTQQDAGFGSDSPNKIRRQLNQSTPRQPQMNVVSATGPIPTHALTVVPAPPTLHSLPLELSNLIVDCLVPPSPYLERVFGSREGHFPVAPAIRALDNWGATCTHAKALIAALRKDCHRLAFRQLASALEYECRNKTPQARALALERYGVDPIGMPSLDQSLVLDVHAAIGLQNHIQKLEQRASELCKLELRLNRASYPDLTLLAGQLARCTQLQVLSLHSNAPFPTCLLEALQELPALRTLELHGHGLPDDWVARLLRLPAASSIESLCVDVRELDVRHLQAFKVGAASLGNLRFLRLEAAALAPPDCAAIASLCLGLSRLESLHIGAHTNALSVAGAHKVVQTLCTNTTRITRLGLQQLAAAEDQQLALFATLRHYPHLRELSLSGALQSACANALQAMLTDPTMLLQALDLAADLDQVAVLALAKGITASDHLRELRLANVKFTDLGVQELGAAVLACKLLRLTLDKCEIDPEQQLRSLCEVVSGSANLLELHLNLPTDRSGNADILRTCKTQHSRDIFCAAD